MKCYTNTFQVPKISKQHHIVIPAIAHKWSTISYSDTEGSTLQYWKFRLPVVTYRDTIGFSDTKKYHKRTKQKAKTEHHLEAAKNQPRLP